MRRVGAAGGGKRMDGEQCLEALESHYGASAARIKEETDLAAGSCYKSEAGNLCSEAEIAACQCDRLKSCGVIVEIVYQRRKLSFRPM